MTKSMQIIRKDSLKYALAATDSFIAEVEDGETFEIETELNIGGHLITLNLVIAILVAAFFLLMQKTEPTALPGSEMHQVLEKAAGDQ